MITRFWAEFTAIEFNYGCYARCHHVRRRQPLNH